jgi:hypothetical protein
MNKETSSLLRSINKEFGTWLPKPYQQKWRKQLIQEFRTTPLTPETMAITKTLHSHLKNLNSHKQLMIQYNIGAYVEERERIKKASAKVGFSLPSFFDEKQ